MPCYRLSLAVRVACQPYLVCFQCLFTQRIDKLYLIFINHIVRCIAIAKVNAHAIFTHSLYVTHMPLRRHQTKILAQIFGNGLSLAGRLYDHQILAHCSNSLFFKDFKVIPDAQVTTKPIYNKVSFSQNGGKGSTFISYVQIYFSAFSYYLYKVKFFVFLLFCLHICIIFCTFAA